MVWNKKRRGKFKNREEAIGITVPVLACLYCGWFTTEGKTRECPDCKVISLLEHFDSTGEYYKFKELERMEKVGVISGLRRQVRFHVSGLNVNTHIPVHIFTYIADFVYKDENGKTIVHDYKPEVKKTTKDPKGERALSDTFKLKRRALKLIYGHEILIN